MNGGQGCTGPEAPSSTLLHIIAEEAGFRHTTKAGDTSFALGQATTPAGISRGLATYWPGNARKAFIADDPGGGPALIGRDRAGDMSVNVILPFLHAWSFSRGDSALGIRTLSVYQGYRKL